MEGDKGYKKGLWTEEEDRILMEYIRVHGKGRWNRIAKITGLKRCGKSCRLRWINYLSPSIKHGDFSEEEDDLIIRLHNLLGNRWSLIAGRVPGRTDNQVKNHWNTHLSKKLGIKKGKLKINRGPSRSLPVKTTETTESIVMDKSFEPPSCNNNVGFEYQNVIDNSLPGKVGIFEVEEPVVNESFESPFWSFNFDAPSLLEIYIEPIFS